MLSFHEIQSILKQKSPFIFIDRIIEHEKGKRIVALKNVTGSEMFSALHFPEDPVYPGIFIIEAIAQATAVLCSLSADQETNDQARFLALGGLQRFTFLNPVRPGDTLRIEVETVILHQNRIIVNAAAKVGNLLAAQGQLSFGAVKNE